MWLSGAKPISVRERFICPAKHQEDMSEDRKRLQEVDATIERLVAHLMETYQERSEIRRRLSD